MLVEIIISLVLPFFIWGIITYVGKRKMPPGPFPLPLIGNTLEMLRDPHNPFEKLAKKYGDIFTFYRPAGAIVVLNTASLIRDARVGRKDDLSGRNSEHAYPFGEILGCNALLMSDYSPAYIFRRRVFKSAMHVFGSGIEDSVDRARQAVDIAIEEIDCNPEKPFCPTTLLENAILAQLWGWLSMKKEPLNGTTVASLREYINIATELALQSPLFHLFPFLRNFPTECRRKIKRAQEITRSIFLPVFRAHQKTYIPGVVRDLTDSFVSSAHTKEKSLKRLGKILDH